MTAKSGTCLILLLILTLVPFAAAQQGELPGEEGEENIPENPGIAPPPPPVEPPPIQSIEDQQWSPDLIIISGKVIREDKSPPPFGTIIERDCGGVLIKEGLVDSNGYFNIVLGDSNRASSLFPDATENYSFDGNSGGSYSERNMRRMQQRNYPEDLVSCLVQARYAGYQSTAVRLGIGQTRGLIDVGTIVIYPLSRGSRNVIDAASLMIPASARKALNKGRKAFEENEFEKAERHYRSAIQIYPEYADAWIELGWLHQKQRQNDKARKAYEEALKADKTAIGPYIRLAQLSAMEERWKESEEYSKKALELNSTSFPQAYFFNALAKYNLNQLDSAEKSVRKGIELDRENMFPRMQLVLANILTKKLDPYGSMNAMRRYLEIEPDASDADHIRSLVEKYEQITKNMPPDSSVE